MKKGTIIRCTSIPSHVDWLTVGKEYEVLAGEGDIDLLFGDIIRCDGMNFITDHGEMLYASGITGSLHGEFEIVKQ